MKPVTLQYCSTLTHVQASQIFVAIRISRRLFSVMPSPEYRRALNVHFSSTLGDAACSATHFDSTPHAVSSLNNFGSPFCHWLIPQSEFAWEHSLAPNPCLIHGFPLQIVLSVRKWSWISSWRNHILGCAYKQPIRCCQAGKWGYIHPLWIVPELFLPEDTFASVKGASS